MDLSRVRAQHRDVARGSVQRGNHLDLPGSATPEVGEVEVRAPRGPPCGHASPADEGAEVARHRDFAAGAEIDVDMRRDPIGGAQENHTRHDERGDVRVLQTMEAGEEGATGRGDDGPRAPRRARQNAGEPGKHNGTAGAWSNSSLQISPLEQVAFLRKVANRTLPVSANALDMTWRVTEIAARPDGWAIHGKTGTGSPGAPITHEGNYDRAHAYGWFVGWATKGPRTLVFARLTQDAQMQPTPAGMRTRDALLSELPSLVDGVTR